MMLPSFAGARQIWRRIRRRRDHHLLALIAATPELQALADEIRSMRPSLTAPGYGRGALAVERWLDGILERHPHLADAADDLHRHYSALYSSAAVRRLEEGE